MAKDPNEIVVGANGTIYLAPAGTTMPANIGAAIPAGFDDMGYASEDGVTLNATKAIESIRVWQSFYAARRIVTERDFTTAFVLRQFNGVNVENAFEGTVTEDAPGMYRFEPDEPEVLHEKSAIVAWADGDKNYRLCVPKALSIEAVETVIQRAAPSDLPMTLGILGEEGVKPWYFLTDDPAWAEAVGS
jgi:hypothetical protein